MVSTNCGLTSFKRRTIWNISTACSTFSCLRAFMHAMKVPEQFPPSLNKDYKEFLNIARNTKVQGIQKFQYFGFTDEIYLQNFFSWLYLVSSDTFLSWIEILKNLLTHAAFRKKSEFKHVTFNQLFEISVLYHCLLRI